MRTQPGKARSLATVGRHYESSRLGGQLMASAYERLIPILRVATRLLLKYPLRFSGRSRSH